MKKENIIITIASILVISMAIITLRSFNILKSDNEHKEYILKNSHIIEKSDGNSFYSI